MKSTHCQAGKGYIESKIKHVHYLKLVVYSKSELNLKRSSRNQSASLFYNSPIASRVSRRSTTVSLESKLSGPPLLLRSGDEIQTTQCRLVQKVSSDLNTSRVRFSGRNHSRIRKLKQREEKINTK